MQNDRRLSILLGADFRSGSATAAAEAARLATRSGAPATIHAVFVAPAARSTKTYDKVAAVAPENLLLFASTNGCRGIQQHTDLVLAVHLRFGDPAEQIAQLAADVSADAIVIGPREQPPAVGPLAERLREDRNRPVLVATVDEGDFPRGIDRRPACGECAFIRRRTEGTRWFCEAHRPEAGSLRSFDRLLVRHWESWEPTGGAIPAF